MQRWTWKIGERTMLNYLLLSNIINLFILPNGRPILLNGYDIAVYLSELAENTMVLTDDQPLDEFLALHPLQLKSNLMLVTLSANSSVSNMCLGIATSFELVIILTRDRDKLLDTVATALNCSDAKSTWNPIILVLLSASSSTLASITNFPILNDTAWYTRIDSNLYFLVTLNNSSSKTLWEASSRTVVEVYSIIDEIFVNEITINGARSFDAHDSRLQDLHCGICRRTNFGGLPLRGIVANYPGFEIESELRNVSGKLEFVGGLSVFLFLEMAFTLNFLAVPMQSSGWMWKNWETGQWQGVGRQIMRKEGDIGVSVTVISEDRSDFTFLPPIRGTNVFVFFVQPPASDFKDIFQQPFDSRLFFAAAGLYALIFTLTSVVRLIRPRKKVHIVIPVDPDYEFRNNIGFALITAACMKGWHRIPSSHRLRWVFLCTTLFGYLLYIAFAAALVSTLTSESLPIKNLQELLSSSITLAGDAYIPFVVTTLQGIHRTADANELKKRGVMFGLGDSPPLVLQRKFAFMSFRDEFVAAFKPFKYDDYAYCRHVSTVQATTLPTPLGMFTQKDSPYIEYFQYATIKVKERGINSRWMRWYDIMSQIQCTRSDTHYRSNLTVADLYSAYVVIISGLLLGLVCGTVERIYCELQRRALK